MKEVLAVIRMNKMNETKRALADAGVASMTARKVIGRGKGKVDYMLLKGAEEGYEEAINQLSPGPKLIPNWLNLGLGYKLIHKEDSSGEWLRENRPYIDLTFKDTFAGFEYSDRNRLEFRDNETKKDVFRYRNCFKIYNMLSKPLL